MTKEELENENLSLQEENEKLQAKLAKAQEAPPIVANPTASDLSEYKDGKFKNSAGEEFQLKIVEDDELGRTHKLKNNEHFWEGTKEDFKKEFEKL